MPARQSVRPRDPKEVASAAAALHRPRPTARTAGAAKKSGCRHSTSSATACRRGGAEAGTGRAACCHDAGKLASSTESRAHAFLLLDRVAVRARRSSTAEIIIVSSMDHHSTTTRRLNRAFGEYLPQGVIDGRIQGALSAQRAGCMQLAPRVHAEVAGTHGVAGHAPRRGSPAAAAVHAPRCAWLTALRSRF